MFHVGQKVVCVNNGPMQNNAGVVISAPQLRHHRIYSVSDVWPDGRIFLIEAEAISGHCGFNPERFRPVVGRKTDISIFTEMLTPKTEKVTA